MKSPMSEARWASPSASAGGVRSILQSNRGLAAGLGKCETQGFRVEKGTVGDTRKPVFPCRLTSIDASLPPPAAAGFALIASGVAMIAPGVAPGDTITWAANDKADITIVNKH